MPVFQYLVYKEEKTNKDGDVVDEAKLLVDIKTVIAKTEKQVGLMAAREVPATEEDLDRIQVMIRPF